MRFDWKQIFILFSIILLIIVLWNTWVVFPLKILVVFFHELSHALAAWLTGGKVIEIQLNASQGGHCITRGGMRFVVLTAGYLGSLIMGGTILSVAARGKQDKVVIGILGLIILGVTMFLVRPIIHFGFLFGLLSGLLLFACGVWLPQHVNEFILKVIGLTSCLYVLLDIKSDVLDRPNLRSDAYMLGELTHIPTVVWGVFWLSAAFILTIYFLRNICRK